jgi:hypothetical protein
MGTDSPYALYRNHQNLRNSLEKQAKIYKIVLSKN